MREEAAAIFSRRLQTIRNLANDAEANYRRYMAGCYGKVTTTQPAVPPGVPLDSVVIGGRDALVAQGQLLPDGTGPGPSISQNDTTPQCRILLNDIATQTATINRELDDIEAAALRGGIYPGVLRDLRREYGF
jgi:hypothetical protein